MSKIMVKISHIKMIQYKKTVKIWYKMLTEIIINH
jgi:hypothetical protein